MYNSMDISPIAPTGVELFCIPLPFSLPLIYAVAWFPYTLTDTDTAQFSCPHGISPLGLPRTMLIVIFGHFSHSDS